MASYCTQADIEALTPKLSYDASSTPTTTQLATVMAFIASELDVILSSRGVTVPVTEPAEFLEWLSYLNALGAGAVIEAGMFPGATGQGATSHSTWLLDLYKEKKAELGTIGLPDSLPKASSGAPAASYATVQTDYDTYPDPVFRKESSDKEF